MRHARRGAAAIDFALTAALGFVPLLMGTMEYSWYAFQQLQTETAVQKGLRTAVMLPLDDDSEEDAEVLIENELLEASVRGTATITTELLGTPPLIEMRVVAEVEYTSLFGLFPTPSANRTTRSARMEDQG